MPVIVVLDANVAKNIGVLVVARLRLDYFNRLGV